MSKKVLIISASLRTGANSELLAKEFAKGAQSKGHSVEFVSLANKNISFCKGCLSCQKTKSCTIKDDMAEIVEKAKEANVILFATPIYYYEMSGQLKTLLDRLNPVFASEYKFEDIYFITTSADTHAETSNYAVNGLEGWIECFPKCSLKGVLKGHGVMNAGDAAKTDYPHQAYIMGENI